MRSDAFFKNKGGTTAPGFDLGEFEDDMHARVHAIWMLKREQCDSIEVWDGIHEPFTVEPTPLESRRPRLGGQATGRMH